MNREELPPTASPEEPLPEAHHAGLMARFRNYFLTGLIVAGPVAITLYLTWWFVNWVDSIVKRSEEHTSELQSQSNLVCRLLLEKKKALAEVIIIERVCLCA